MGPQRHNWSFPYKAHEVILAILTQTAAISAQLDESITQENDYDRRLAEFREMLRSAGVTQWATAKLDPADPAVTGYGRTSNPEAAFRDRQKKLSQKLIALNQWRLALVHDNNRDPDRTFKLTADDLAYFGITSPYEHFGV